MKYKSKALYRQLSDLILSANQMCYCKILSASFTTTQLEDQIVISLHDCLSKMIKYFCKLNFSYRVPVKKVGRNVKYCGIKSNAQCVGLFDVRPVGSNNNKAKYEKFYFLATSSQQIFGKKFL